MYYLVCYSLVALAWEFFALHSLLEILCVKIGWPRQPLETQTKQVIDDRCGSVQKVVFDVAMT